ncbi:MAG: 2-amino-4-hydroxy-6-hydroxymethyldihydropteridine diphosphokinase [Planctomycetota bacterium]|nr:2-amino-4-hydroxy-6-hydroxymethyldihydropteridine diphosphokinase [Planctomycetota bacterium]
MNEPIVAYLGLGSNLDDRAMMIESAYDELAKTNGIELIQTSRLYETDPVGPGSQGQYLNAAAHLRTMLSPRELLEAILAIELSNGRDRAREERWGPRTLDIDLLLYGNRRIDEPGLQVPHPRMADRGFVLIPLAEIAPQVRHPILDLTIQELKDRLAIESCGK